MKKSTRRIVLFLVFFTAILAGYFVFRVVFRPHVNVPQEFSDARTRGAIIAQDIVNSSNKLDTEIAHINELDSKKEYDVALKETLEVSKDSQKIRTLAVDLSKEVQIMTQALQDIDSDPARQAALDSISNRLALISRLITYTDEVDQLLGALTTHFKGGTVKSDDISRLVNQVNGEVRAINTFNSQAGQAMDRFDKIVR